jgi:hypothetical protein
MSLKKCKECGKEISTAASKCPNCGKPQTKNSTWILLGIIAFFFIIGIMPVLFHSPSPSLSIPIVQDTPQVNQNATDAQIYREFEVCMNNAKKEKDDNKLEYQHLSGECMLRLNKYGKKRAAKAFNLYFDM